jgi:hypothetical protein
MIYIIFLLNIRNISVFIYVSVRYPIRIRYPLNIRSVSVFETIRIWKIITDINTIKTLSVRIRSVCNPNYQPPPFLTRPRMGLLLSSNFPSFSLWFWGSDGGKEEMKPRLLIYLVRLLEISKPWLFF